jgi:small subunit ribosomal protein S2
VKENILICWYETPSKYLIAQEAKRCDSYYINHRWLGGMLTNWTTLTERIQRFKNLEQQEADNTFNLLTKKRSNFCVEKNYKVTNI